MKKISILIVSLILLLVVGCEKNSKEVVEEGKNTPSVNLIALSESKYFIEGEFVSEDNKDNGYYKQTYKYGSLDFTFERMKHKNYSDFPLAIKNEKIYDLKSDNKEINGEINTKLQYPILKATYITKYDNKDIFNEDILISTVDWDFRIHLQTNKENYNENYSIIEDIVNNLKVDEIS